MRITYGSRRPADRRTTLTPIGLGLVVGIVMFLVCLISYGMITEPDRARDILVERGYTDIHVQPRRTFVKACGRSRGTAPGFVAIDPSGRLVSGVVCTSPLFTDVAETTD